MISETRANNQKMSLPYFIHSSDPRGRRLPWYFIDNSRTAYKFLKLDQHK